jgi:hypothetical protein
MAIKAEEKAQMEKDAVERKAKAEEKAKAAEPPVPQVMSKLAESLNLLEKVAFSCAKQVKADRFRIIQAQNEYRAIKLKVNEAEKHLASLESKANLALQNANSGIRSLSDRLAIEKAANSDKEERLKQQERTLVKSMQEAEEMKAMYKAKLEGIVAVKSAVPGD